jgi:putative transposase
VWLLHQQNEMSETLSLSLNMQPIITESPQFFTATILEWKRLLKPDKYKDIIISSLQFLAENNRVKVNAFVIMDNHMHLIWQMMAGIKPEAVQRDFMKFTAQKIKQDLLKNHPAVLAHFKVNAKDREYQFWERNALSIELGTLEMFKQKLEYIHYNPVLAGLSNLPEEYKYSTAKFYETGINDWGFVTHYTE